ncbi:porin family protein [Psychroflexus aestuariivivens]|uniref:porin family protein n=1 Tax=Psychroflexus aestuariivivens TaxID=1795040 RepID=UPI000FDB0AFD|nr:porin family protein [Psychroflexus aestuariivivens]
MKKLFIFTIALGLFATNEMKAQEYFEFGFKGGVNLSNLTGDNTDDLDPRTTMNIGVFGIYKVTDKIGVQAEILYSEQGTERESVFFDGFSEIEEDYVLKTQYINLPLMASYNVIENLWVEAGPQIGYLVKAEVDLETTTEDNLGSVESSTETQDVTDSYESIDMALNVGLRYKLARNFLVQARYSKGITDITEAIEGNQNNQIYSFSVGYVF